MVGAKNRMFNTPSGKIVTVQDALKAGVITADQLPTNKEEAIALANNLDMRDRDRVLEAASDRLGFMVNNETIKAANLIGAKGKKTSLPKRVNETNINRVKKELNKVKIDPRFIESYEYTSGVAGGMRGQGRRSGKMVKGGMASVAQVKETRERPDFKSLGLSQSQIEKYKEFTPAWSASGEAVYQSSYLKARSAGYDHENSLNYAILNS